MAYDSVLHRGRNSQVGEKEGGEKKKEIDGENELEPVRLDPELGIPRVYLPLAFFVHQGEGTQ